MKKIEAIKIIRKELEKENPNWIVVRRLCERFHLSDTAFRDKLFHKDKEALLKDFLLDLKYWQGKT